MKYSRRICFYLGIVLSAFTAFCCLEPANAVSRTITITPTTEQIELSPGETYTNKLTIRNNGEGDFNYDIEVSPYQVSDYDYQIKEDVENEYTEIVDWISLSETSGYLAPGESADIYYTITVPYRAHGGGQYAKISASFGGDEENMNASGLKISGGVSEILYARVDGDIRESGEILASKITGFTFNPPLLAKTTVSNAGNVDATLKSTMVIKSFFTGKELYNNTDDPQYSIILPETIRDVSVGWGNTPFVGVFKAELLSEYLESSQKINKVVIVCPVWLILLVIALIVFIILKLTVLSKRNTKHRKRASKFSI